MEIPDTGTDWIGEEQRMPNAAMAPAPKLNMAVEHVDVQEKQPSSEKQKKRKRTNPESDDHVQPTGTGAEGATTQTLAEVCKACMNLILNSVGEIVEYNGKAHRKGNRYRDSFCPVKDSKADLDQRWHSRRGKLHRQAGAFQRYVTKLQEGLEPDDAYHAAMGAHGDG